MKIAGITTDVFVSKAGISFPYWQALMGREPDVVEGDGLVEWRLAVDPEVNVRIVVDPEQAGHARLGLGVPDLEVALTELSDAVGRDATRTVKPGVITMATFADPDGNLVTLWQDLMGSVREG